MIGRCDSLVLGQAAEKLANRIIIYVVLLDEARFDSFSRELSTRSLLVLTTLHGPSTTGCLGNWL